MPRADGMPVPARKKLIEVALPLDAINAAAAREKSIRHGHPSTLHLWWARRPLAAARAVIFAQMVDDPSEYVDVLLSDPVKKRQAQQALRRRSPGATSAESSRPADRRALSEMVAELERGRLFRILEELVLWENTTNEEVLERARAEIWQSWRRACAANADHPRAQELFDRHKLPAFHDPFAGGGSLPLEAQRLGLEAHASDLNPVAVLINKAMIEIPPRFAGRPPVNPEARNEPTVVARTWRGAQGLAEDVRHYGRWMRDEAAKRIGHLYPPVEITPALVKQRPDLKPYEGRKLTVIAWLWARTVKSPNPAFADVDVPLASTFMLSTKTGKEAYVEPVIEGRGYRFMVKVGSPPDANVAKAGTKLSRGANFRCIMSGSPMSGDYIRAEGQAKRMNERLMAVVAVGDRGRVYLPPSAKDENTARSVIPEWRPEVEFFQQALGFRVGNYGISMWGDLFTHRQILALTTFSDLVHEAMERVRRDATAAGLAEDDRPLRDGGTGTMAYAEAVAVYLALAVDKVADRNSTVCAWASLREHARNTFGRQAIPMVWDFAESNSLSDSSGNFLGGIVSISSGLGSVDTNVAGHSSQRDARVTAVSSVKVISTDPPYYDNIGYADLSDFFYVWLRRPMRPVFPRLFGTMTVPKEEELVATPYRHGGMAAAEVFFLDGMTEALRRLSEQTHPGFPITIYYAFKQSETKGETGAASTGWETFLDAVIRSGFAITGTWPMRTELDRRMRGMDSNALASSIVLVCGRRSPDALPATRRKFLTALRSDLPLALRLLQTGNIAPVDLAQAAIGPGMAVYTRYTKVLDAAGDPMSVREALALINQILDEVLAEQEGDFDADSRWALEWFDQYGFETGDYGDAETLSKAKNTSVAGMVEAGIVKSRSGQVRLLRPRELPDYWDPEGDTRLTAWEIVHHLVRTLELGGELAAAVLVRKLGGRREVARELCYRLYTLCDRKKRPAEALAYNGLVQSWPEICRLAGTGTGNRVHCSTALARETHEYDLQKQVHVAREQDMSLIARELREVWDALRASNGHRQEALTAIRISRLRGIWDIRIPLEYPVSVLAGPNGCGKSTVLFACACAYRAPGGSPRDFTPGSLFPNFISRQPAVSSDARQQTQLDFQYVHHGNDLSVTWRRRKSWTRRISSRTQGSQPERQVYLRTLANLTNPSEVRSVLQLGRKQVQTETLSAELLTFAHRILPWRYRNLELISGPSSDLLFAEVEGLGQTRYSEFHMSSGERSILRISKEISALENALVPD